MLDEKRSPLVRLAFQLYVTGDWSLRGLAEYLAEQACAAGARRNIPNVSSALTAFTTY